MKERIFVVEDDESIRHLLKFALESQGYTPVSFSEALPALEAMRSEPPALVLMDLMLDGLDGVSAVRLMRQDHQLRSIPVIILTAKALETDKITGLDAGADDYITKPFSVMELCARVRAVLRRTDASHGSGGGILSRGGLSLNLDRREVQVDGAPVELTFKEYELLRYLVERAGKNVSRTELLEQIWGSGADVETRTLDIHIGTLRQKLGDQPEHARFIKTVRGVGYRFIGGEK